MNPALTKHAVSFGAAKTIVALGTVSPGGCTHWVLKSSSVWDVQHLPRAAEALKASLDVHKPQRQQVGKASSLVDQPSRPSLCKEVKYVLSFTESSDPLRQSQLLPRRTSASQLDLATRSFARLL